tara:strand:+ start:367 stop:1050 length:684 start_codon:yes stop_codon:yes gene_type:complete
MKDIIWLLAFILPSFVSAEAYNDGILTLGGRDFFIGDTERRPESTLMPQFSFSWSPWLNSALSDDPILRGHSLRIQQTGIPSRELMDTMMPSDTIYSVVVTDPNFLADGFRVNQTTGGLSFQFTPVSSTLDYIVNCSLARAWNNVSGCRLTVVYPYSTHVILKADISYIFAGGIALSDYAERAEDIANRLIEVAVCLDVTERADEIDAAEFLAKNPRLEACEILLPS